MVNNLQRALISLLLVFMVFQRKSFAELLPQGGSIDVFMVDEAGHALSASVTGAVTTRVKELSQQSWSAPITRSNQGSPPDFTGILAAVVTASAGANAAIGAYVPVGYRMLRYGGDIADCPWNNEGHSPPAIGPAYQMYQPSYPDASTQRQTLIMQVPPSGVRCVTFMLEPDRDYSQFGKNDTSEYGQYIEKPWSSPMGLKNVANDRIVSIERSTRETAVKLDISETVGATIVHLILQDLGPNGSAVPIQLIRSNDAADSGLQWSTIMRGVATASVSKDAAFNQAVGADPTWMWGMDVPLEIANDDPDYINLRSPPGSWVPLFSDYWDREPSAASSDRRNFLPRSPLFQPSSLHLFDGRVEELSLRRVGLHGGASVIEVRSNFHVRSHLTHPFTAGFYRNILWAAFTSLGRSGGLAHRVQIHLIKADGSQLFLGNDHGSSSIEQAWTVSGFGRLKPQTSCSAMSCDADFDNLARIVLVYDPCIPSQCLAREKLVSIHLPGIKPFSAEVMFTNKTAKSNAGFGVFLTYDVEGRRLGESNGPEPRVIIDPDYNNGANALGDTVVFSIGRNSDLNRMTPAVGY